MVLVKIPRAELEALVKKVIDMNNNTQNVNAAAAQVETTTVVEATPANATATVTATNTGSGDTATVKTTVPVDQNARAVAPAAAQAAVASTQAAVAAVAPPQSPEERIAALTARAAQLEKELADARASAMSTNQKILLGVGCAAAGAAAAIGFRAWLDHRNSDGGNTSDTGGGNTVSTGDNSNGWMPGLF